MVTRLEAAKATVRGALRRKAESYAVAVEFDPNRRWIVITFNSGGAVGVPSDLVEGLSNADEKALENVEITPSGLGLYWPDLDVDVYLPSLMMEVQKCQLYTYVE